jgi:hypothetical protein
MAEDELAIDADHLHAIAIEALKITGAAALLALSSWAHWKLGDLDQAWHLLREAYDRRAGLQIERAMPRLHLWMEAHRVEAGVDPHAGEEPELPDEK